MSHDYKIPFRPLQNLTEFAQGMCKHGTLSTSKHSECPAIFNEIALFVYLFCLFCAIVWSAKFYLISQLTFFLFWNALKNSFIYSLEWRENTVDTIKYQWMSAVTSQQNINHAIEIKHWIKQFWKKNIKFTNVVMVTKRYHRYQFVPCDLILCILFKSSYAVHLKIKTQLHGAPDNNNNNKKETKTYTVYIIYTQPADLSFSIQPILLKE